MTLEATVVRAVVKALSEHRGPHGEQAATWNHAPSGETGIPDRFAVYRGRLLAIECKRARGGRLSAKQRWWLDRLAAAGAIALVVTDAGQVRDALCRIDEEQYAETPGKPVESGDENTPALVGQPGARHPNAGGSNAAPG